MEIENEDDSVKDEDQFLGNQKMENMMIDEEQPFVQQIDINSNRSAFFKQQKRQFQQKSSKVINLNHQCFEGLVQLCRSEQLITEELAHSFFNNHSSSMDRTYIELYYDEQLSQYDFAKCKINIIDHRRLSQMLIKHKPYKYIPYTKPQQPYDFIPQVRNFLRDIYALPAIHYQTLIQMQANQYYQSWWGGPKYISPVVDPPVKFSETEQGKKLREDKQNTIRIQSYEQQRERLRRINQQRATNTDLMDIAKLLSNKLYGVKPPQNEPKLQGSEQQSSMNSSVDESSGNSSKKKKQKKGKKDKKVKKDKKEKKDKKKSKKKKESKDKEIKQQDSESSKPKKQPDNPQPKPKKNKKTK